MSYVITYEQTDPLFIIDLAKPASPVIKSHVKITGFSTLLVLVDQEHLLGFGFSTETTDMGEATNGLKLALFDVKDPSNPKVSDSKEYPHLSSPLQYDHRALLVGAGGEYYGLPYDRYQPARIDEVAEKDTGEEEGETTTDEGSSDETAADEGSSDETAIDEGSSDEEAVAGILLIDARKGKIRQLKDLPAKTTILRCIYVGDFLYGIAGDDSIQAFPLK